MEARNHWPRPTMNLWSLGIVPQAIGLTTMWGELTEEGRTFARTHFPRALDPDVAVACHTAVTECAPRVTIAGQTHHELPHHEYLTLLGEELLRRCVISFTDMGIAAIACKRLTIMDALCVAAAAAKTAAHEADVLYDCANSVLFRNSSCACHRCRS